MLPTEEINLFIIENGDKNVELYKKVFHVLEKEDIVIFCRNNY